MRENRENEIARARVRSQEEFNTLPRARDVYLRLSISRVYRQRRINSSVEAALYATVDRSDKFSLSRRKKKIKRAQRKLLYTKKRKK